MKVDELRMIDIRDPKTKVEVVLSMDHKNMWVNVEGLCLVRIQGMKEPPSIILGGAELDLDN